MGGGGEFWAARGEKRLADYGCLTVDRISWQSLMPKAQLPATAHPAHTIRSMEITAEQTAAYQEELSRLFYVFRVTQLNLRYYGSRAAKFSKLVTGAQVLAAALSAAALAILSIPGVNLKVYAGLCAALSAVIAGTLPSFGWSEKARDLYALHVAHKQLFGKYTT